MSALDYPVTLDFGDQGPETFKSAETLRAFLHDEQNTWFWIEKHRHHFSNLHQYWNNLNHAMHHGFDQPLIENILANYRLNKVYKSNHPNTRLMAGLSNDYEKIGSYITFANNSGDNNLPLHPSIIRGATLTTLYLEKPKKITFSSDSYNKICRQISDNQIQLSEFIASKNTEFDELKNSHHEQFEKILSEHLKEMSNCQTKFNDLEKTYFERLGLQAPALYWRNKKESHRISYEGWKKISIAYFSTVIVLLSIVIFWIVPSNIKIIEGAQHFYIFSSVTFMAIIFWAGRLITRMLLSEKHLAVDAEERSIMAETYLALIHEQAASPTERPLVLASLFRNSSDGIVKDDGSSDISLGAIVSRMMTPIPNDKKPPPDNRRRLFI